MAKKINLLIDQGATFSTDIALVDENGDVINLAGCTVASSIKKWYTSSNSIPFAISTNNVTGDITLSLDANTTTQLVPNRYVFDVSINSSGVVSRIVEGIITVSPKVT